MVRLNNKLFPVIYILLLIGCPYALRPSQQNEMDANPAGVVIPFLNIADYENKPEYNARVNALVDSGVAGFLVRVEDVEQTKRVIARLQGRTGGRLIFCADLEAGTFFQTNPAFNLLSTMAWSAVNDSGAVYRYASAVAKLCLYTGIRMNLAPVADINDDPGNSVIALRSFGDNKMKTVAFTSAYARAMLDNGILPVLKHFPGHGSTKSDSHYELPVIRKNYAELSANELTPFSNAVRNSFPCIMMGHLALPKLDSMGNPSSVSPALCRELLRDSLRFKGLIITDGLQMKAVSSRFTDSAIVVNAILAGNDVLLGPGETFSVLRNLKNALIAGVIDQSMILSSKKRLTDALVQISGNFLKKEITGKHLVSEFESVRAELMEKAPSLVNDPTGIIKDKKIAAKTSKVIVLFDSSNAKQAEECYAELSRSDRQIPIQKFNLEDKQQTLFEMLPSLGEDDVLIVHLFLKSGSTLEMVDPRSTISGNLKQLGLIRNCIALSYKDPYAPIYLPNTVSSVNLFGYNKLYPVTVSKKLFKHKPLRGTNPLKTAPVHSYSSIAEHEIDDARFTRVTELIDEAISSGTFPGASVEISQNGAVVFRKSFGRFTYDLNSRPVTNYTKFDLASVSKVIATTTAAMILYDRGLLRLDNRVADYIPEFGAAGKDSVTIGNLLLHNSGLPAFKPFYKTMHSPDEVINDIYLTPLTFPSASKTVYSDLGMITLGKVIERISGMTLDAFCAENIFKPLGMHHTCYSPPADERINCAPTEYDSLWRRRLIQGEVHDEASSLLGGVAGHAGLFSTAGDLGILLSVLYCRGRHGETQFINENTVKLFTKRAGELSTRALGWDTKSDSLSSAGNIMSKRSFGHTGFTGTSVWVDPSNGCYVVLLTNRVYPTRKNNGISYFRPKFHDAILRILQGE